MALSYDIRLARASAEADGDSATETTLSRAIDETLSAVEEIRELARGIFPAILSEAGLGPALATLADTASLPVEIRQTDDRRYPGTIETTAYFVVAQAVDDAARRGADHACVTVARRNERLTVTVEDNGRDRTAPMVAPADRVGAVGGALFVQPTACRMEIPCE